MHLINRDDIGGALKSVDDDDKVTLMLDENKTSTDIKFVKSATILNNEEEMAKATPLAKALKKAQHQ